MKKVFIFGVFDGVHEGHRALFKQAKTHGDHVIVAVAQDRIVRDLKGRLPERTLRERMEILEKGKLVDEVIAGDEELGTYEVLRQHKPDIIALGYDQKALRKDLQDRSADLGCAFEVVILEPYEPEKYHSSLLNKK